MIPRRTVHVLFFLSGAAGLVYETLWARCLALTLGHTAHAYALVMALYLGGLALGGVLLGPAADRSPDRLRLYGLLELGVGLLGFASIFLLRGEGAGLARAAAALLPTTMLMGGTLPALSRLRVADADELESSVSRLYFVNSAGAVAGTLLAGLWMIPALGLDLSLAAAAAVNAAIGAYCLSRPRAAAVGRAEPRSAPAVLAPKGARVIYAAVFVSGFASLAYEIAWTRLLALVLGSSAYSFTLMLAGFIGGIALGSLAVAERRSPPADPGLEFGLAELGAALALAATLPLYPRLPYLFLRLQTLFAPTPATFFPFLAVELLSCFLLTVLPAALIGATLPLAVRAVSRGTARAGAEVGRVFAFNTAGCVLGSCAAGLWLLPRLGLRPLLELGMLLNCAAGAAVLLFPGTKRRGWAAAGLPVALAAVAASALAGGWDARALICAPYRFRGALAGSVADAESYRRMLAESDVVFYREDADVSVAVTRRRDGELSLRLNGKADASTGGDMASQVLLGHIPLLLKPSAKRVFMVGLGSGVSAGAALRHPIERLDLAEISPGVADAARLFSAANHAALDDPRLRLHLGDARTVLSASTDTYDAIISEPTNPWIAGVGELFGEEFYRAASAHLRPGGVVAQWYHVYAMTDELLLSTLKTFRAEFPYVTVWGTFPGDLVLVGSREPLSPDFAETAARFQTAGVRADLARVGVGRLTTFLSLEMASDAQVRRILDASLTRESVNRDRFPRLEFEAPKAFYLSSEATAVAAEDQRAEGDPDRELYWSRYFGGRAPTRAELDDLAAFHGRYPSPVSAAIDAARGKPFPEPPPAGGPLEEADRELIRYYSRRSFLNPGDPAPALAAVRRLEKSGTVGPGVLGQKWAGLHAATEPRRALEELKAVGRIAETNRARGGANVLVGAARLAVRLGDYPEALACARRAAALDPSNPGALVLRERLENLVSGR